MGDRGVENARAAAEGLRDERLRKGIVALAYRLTGNASDARDLAQEAMVRAIDPLKSPWDPAKQTLFLHVGSIMNSLLANKRRAEKRRPTAHRVNVHDPKRFQHADPQPLALQPLLEQEEDARLEYWLELLRERLAGDKMALAKLDLVRQGIDDADEQATRLRCRVQDIYRTNERIAYHADRVKKQAPDGRPSTLEGPRTEPKPDGPEVDG